MSFSVKSPTWTNGFQSARQPDCIPFGKAMGTAELNRIGCTKLTMIASTTFGNIMENSR